VPPTSPAPPPPIGTWAREVRPALSRLLRLAGPVVVAELGWMAMGLVDTVMVGPLGPDAIGAVGLGSGLFMAVAIFGMGLLLGLDTLVSHAFGAGRRDECDRWLVHGLVLGIVVAVPLTAIVVTGLAFIDHAGLHPDVERLTIPYLRAVTWSLLPLLGYAALRRYLQGMGLVRPVTFALVSANLVNLAGNWALIYGHLGVPALGVAGAAWATCLARVYMVAVLAVAVIVHDQKAGSPLRTAWHPIEPSRLARLFRLGFPAAAQVTLEVGVFAAATALAGTLDPVSLASHQIALNVAAFVFMVPLGMASASAVVVGHAVGRGDARGAGVAGWTALALISAFMLLVAAMLVSIPHRLLSVFTGNAAVIATGTTLLWIAAVFQLFDGLQAVATGVLRGVGDTRTPMLWNLAGHWMLGLPVGYFLCFRAGWGVQGLWVGLSVGLTSVGILLVLVWARRVTRLGAAADYVRHRAGPMDEPNV
jgi:MATE family multidrug resistance protein